MTYSKKNLDKTPEILLQSQSIYLFINFQLYLWCLLIFSTTIYARDEAINWIN